MAFYYVKSGGTATGDGGRYTTAKTGSWATAFSATSQYYGELSGVTSATTLPTSKDVVLVSNSHYSTATPPSGSTCYASLFSVSDSNVDTPSTGAAMRMFSVARAFAYVYGVTFLDIGNVNSATNSYDLEQSIIDCCTYSNSYLNVADTAYTEPYGLVSNITGSIYYNFDFSALEQKTGIVPYSGSQYAGCKLPNFSGGQLFRSFNILGGGSEFIGCTAGTTARTVQDSAVYPYLGTTAGVENVKFSLCGGNFSPSYTDTRISQGNTIHGVSYQYFSNLRSTLSTGKQELFFSDTSYSRASLASAFTAKEFVHNTTEEVTREYGASKDGRVGYAIKIHYGSSGLSEIAMRMLFVAELWDNWSSGKTIDVYGLSADSASCTLDSSDVWLEAYYKSSGTSTNWKFGRAGPSTILIPGSSNATSIANTDKKWRTTPLETWNGSYSTASNGFKVSLTIPSGGGEGPLILFLRHRYHPTASKRVQYVCPRIEF
jgi:hypothetical protein